MKVNVFAAQVHVEDLVVAHIEQNITMNNAKREWDGEAQRSALTLEDMVVAHEQSLPMCNAKLE